MPPCLPASHPQFQIWNSCGKSARAASAKSGWRATLEAWEREVFERTPSDRAERIGAVTGMGRRAFKRIILAVCLAAVLVGGWAVWRALGSGPRVEVNFITDHCDAEIWLDGRRLCQPDGQPWLTPCAVSGLSAELHTVVLKRRGLEDLELGQIDFGKTREDKQGPCHASFCHPVRFQAGMPIATRFCRTAPGVSPSCRASCPSDIVPSCPNRRGSVQTPR